MLWPAGITVRSPTRDDLPEVVALLRRAEQVDKGEATATSEDVGSLWDSPGFELNADALLLHCGAELAAYAEVFAGRAGGKVAPEFAGRGLGTAVVRWQERRAREQAHPHVGLIGQTLPDTATRAIALLSGLGYTPSYDVWALQLPPAVDLSAVGAPAGVAIRPLQPGDERAVYEVIERAFGEWPGRSAQSFEGWRAYTLDRADFDPGLTFVAHCGDGPICAAVYGVHYPDGGWAQQLAVAAEQRRRGIGRALLAVLSREFRRRGEPRLGLGTDSRTGALDLYTSLGMTVQHAFKRWSKPLDPA